MQFVKNSEFADDRRQWLSTNSDGSFYVINYRRTNGRDTYRPKFYESPGHEPFEMGVYYSRALAESRCLAHAKQRERG